MDINVDMDEVLDQITTFTLVEEVKRRRQLVSGRDRKSAEKELRRDTRRSKISIDVNVDEDEVFWKLDSDDLLDECKSRNLIPDEDDDDDNDDNDDNQLYSTWDDLGDLSAYDLSRGLARLTGLPYTATKEQIINALAEKL